MAQSCPSRGFLWAAALLLTAPVAAQVREDARLKVEVGKSIVIDRPQSIQRVALASNTMAEVVTINSKEILVNGLAPGETSLAVWEDNGDRTLYTLDVAPPPLHLDSVREELARDLPGQNVSLEVENGTVFLRGTVRDLTAANRAAAIAGSLGKVVDLLYVDVPPPAAQILLKVRFADVDRTAAQQLGASIISTGAANTTGSTSTGQYGPPVLTPGQSGQAPTVSLSQALNLFIFRPDLNLGAAIQALASKSQLQILAEPNVMATDGKPASFVAGGEFPYPTVQGGANAGAITISFREFGIRLNFLPTVTPRGTIQLHVTPEVSSLDFSNGLLFQGTSIPALDTRRVDTQVELMSGQSFAIAGLLDNQTTRALSKIPGLGDIPLLGRLFQSMTTSKSNSELLIIVTPELVKPAASDKIAVPRMTDKFLSDASPVAPRTPGAEVTGPAPPLSQPATIPVEQLEQIRAAEQRQGQAGIAPLSGVPGATPGSTPGASR